VLAGAGDNSDGAVDPKARSLQQRYLKALVDIGDQIQAAQFSLSFLFQPRSRRRSDEGQTRRQSLDSLRLYKSKTVLEITGNYYAAYPAD
jgi:hypothetical protein